MVRGTSLLAPWRAAQLHRLSDIVTANKRESWRDNVSRRDTVVMTPGKQAERQLYDVKKITRVCRMLNAKQCDDIAFIRIMRKNNEELRSCRKIKNANSCKLNIQRSDSSQMQFEISLHRHSKSIDVPGKSSDTRILELCITYEYL